MKNKNFTIHFRRKREGRTYYKKRVRLLLSNKHRLVVRKSLGNVEASIIEYTPKGDRILLTVSSKALNKIGWKAPTGNMSSAYLTGLLAGKRSLEKGVQEAILDLGFNSTTKGSRIYAVVSGVVDAGLKVPLSPEILPQKSRISGEHIAKYAESLKSDGQKYKRQFSVYIKNGLKPEEIVHHFNEVKGRINGKEKG